MRKKLLLLMLVISLVFVFFSGCVPFGVSSTGLKLYVTDYNSGYVVSGATVKVYYEGTKIMEGTTNDKGLVFFNIPTNVDSGYIDFVISKEGYAVSRFNNVKFEMEKTFTIETQLRKPSVGKTTTEIPAEINVKFYEDSSKATELILNDNELTVNDDIYYEVKVNTSEYDVKYIYVKLGSIPGAGFLTNPRAIFYESPAEGTLSISGFTGITPLYIVTFDQNENMVVNVYYLNIKKEEVSVENPYEVEKEDPSIFAYTRRGGVAFYNNPIKIDKKVVPDFERSSGIEAAPMKDTNLWVEINWVLWKDSTASLTTDEPEAYVIYRSFDGETFEEIATVPEGYNYYRDKSPQLEVGKEVWYKVAAKYSNFVATPTLLGSVIPLDLFEIKYLNPTDGATNVSINPVFAWEVINPVTSEEGTPLYYFDIWLYDNTVNELGYYSLSVPGYPYYSFLATSATAVAFEFNNPPFGWWVDFALGDWYQYDSLQKNKTYEWGNELAVAIVADEDSEAYSIYADQNNVIDPFGVEAEIYNTFTTGEN